MSSRVLSCNQWHSVAISAHHLPLEIAWVNCGTEKSAQETTPHMPHAPVGRQGRRGEHLHCGGEKSAQETTPHMPHAPCTAQASTGSSICSRIIVLEEARYTQPPTAPMMTPAHGITVAQPAVMETSPARIPAK